MKTEASKMVLVPKLTLFQMLNFLNMIALLWDKMRGFSSYYLLLMQNQYIYRVSNLIIVFYHL